MTDKPDPLMSVILITRDNYDSLRPVIQALRSQTDKKVLELVIATVSRDDLLIDDADLQDFARVRVVEVNTAWTSVARAEAVRAARSPLVVFVEDHSFPGPHWAKSLIERHRERWAGVGPVMANANPETNISWANFLIEYGDWIAPENCEAPRHIPGHNSSYKRAALLDFGERLAEVFNAESVMQWEMMSRGYEFRVEPRAICYHWNYSKFLPSLGLRLQGGRLFAANRARLWPLAKRLFYAAASPLIPLIRLRRLWRAAGSTNGPRATMRFTALALILLLFDGFGEFLGYLAGAGKSEAYLSVAEFHRERFLTVTDRRKFQACCAHTPRRGSRTKHLFTHSIQNSRSAEEFDSTVPSPLSGKRAG